MDAWPAVTCRRAAPVAKITGSSLETLAIADSIQATDAAKSASNIRILAIAPLMAEAIARTAREESVSSLFY